MKQIEDNFESIMFKSRWLLAPFFIGLLVAIVALLVKFTKELVNLLAGIFVNDGQDTIIGILTLIDISLIASLLLIIAFSGYENFVSKMNVGGHEDRPAWMGNVSFADLKLKLIGAIVAISAVELLKVFINIHEFTNEQVAWKVGIHLTSPSWSPGCSSR